MTDVLDEIVAKRIWLEYYDQNVDFERAFTPQYCKVLERFEDVGGEKDWYLVELEIPLSYEGANYSHLMIRSRWVDGVVGSKDASAVFIVLAPDSDAISHPFELERSLYIAWGFAALHRDDIRR